MRSLRNGVLAAILFGCLRLNCDGGFNASAFNTGTFSPKAFITNTFVSIAFIPTAKAHGGGTERLVREPVGPYQIFAWSNPEPLRAGDAHITIALILPPDGEQPIDEATLFNELDEVVTGVDIEVTLVSTSSNQAQSGEQLKTKAVPSSINPLYYEADIKLPSSGDWQVVIDVVGDLGSGQATFSASVDKAQLINWKLIGGVSALLLFLIFASRVRATRSRSNRSSSNRARDRGSK